MIGLGFEWGWLYPVCFGFLMYFVRLFYRPRVISWCNNLDPAVNEGYACALEEATDLTGFRSAGKKLVARSGFKSFVAIYAEFLLYIPELLFYVFVLRYLVGNVWLFLGGLLLGGFVYGLRRKSLIKEKV